MNKNVFAQSNFTFNGRINTRFESEVFCKFFKTLHEIYSNLSNIIFPLKKLVWNYMIVSSNYFIHIIAQLDRQIQSETRLDPALHLEGGGIMTSF